MATSSGVRLISKPSNLEVPPWQMVVGAVEAAIGERGAGAQGRDLVDGPGNPADGDGCKTQVLGRFP